MGLGSSEYILASLFSAPYYASDLYELINHAALHEKKTVHM